MTTNKANLTKEQREKQEELSLYFSIAVRRLEEDAGIEMEFGKQEADELVMKLHDYARSIPKEEWDNFARRFEK